MRGSIALFGASEKGHYGKPLTCKSVQELSDFCGNPPEHTRGIELSVQALLYEWELHFFRVHDEGYSLDDYMLGFKEILKNDAIQDISALALPGVGDDGILEASKSIVNTFGSLLILQENDLFDYLTSK